MEQPPLRCRIGLHKWVEVRRSDPELDSSARSVAWESKCRYCGVAQGSGVAVSLAIAAVAVITAVAVFFLLSPLLGAIIMIGAVFALGVVAVPAATSRVARWLSSGR